MGALCCCCHPAGAKLMTYEVNPEVRFDGKVVIVTGANTGIGKETAREFALRGARVILACRVEATGNAAAEEIRQSLAAAGGGAAKGTKKSKKQKKSSGEQIVVLPLNLGDLSSVTAFVDAFEELGVKCDILVNNAGVMNSPKQTTADGLEYQIGINHFGHFYLTTELIKRELLADEDGRIINLSSDAHKMNGVIDFDDMFFENRSYGGWLAYAQSKLANILFTRELFARYGDQYTVAAVHPGIVETDLTRTSGCCTRCCICLCIDRKNPSQGASTTIWTATADAEAVNGHEKHYFADCAPSNNTSDKAVIDEDATRLWEVSEQIIAEKTGKKGKGSKKGSKKGKAPAKKGSKKGSKKAKSASSASASSSS